MTSQSSITPSHLAVYAASGLGDALLAMQLSYQLTRVGHRVALYSSVLRSMAPWFPEVLIKPYPTEDAIEQELADYDHVIAADYTPLSTKQPSSKLSVLHHSHFDKRRTMLSNLLNWGHDNWGTALEPEKPFSAPHGLKSRCNHQRVILHPTSGSVQRNWPDVKFLRLGHRLLKEGYKPVITVSGKEAADWQWVQQQGMQLQVFPTLDAMAAFYFESGFFIGNDSGGGHLASLLNIPTLTLCSRASYLRLWRPGWAPGFVVTPMISLPGAHLKQQFWKHLLTVGHASRLFRKLTVLAETDR